MSETLTTAHAALLERVELFAGPDRITLASLAACVEPLAFDVDALVCRQGDAADGLYVVAHGSFGVFGTDATGRDVRIDSMRPGDVFGELALLTDEPRSATVRAETVGELLRLERDRFQDLLRNSPPIGVAIATTLGRRLRERDGLHVQGAAARATTLDQELNALDSHTRKRVLEASLLNEPSAERLRAVFGDDAPAVEAALRGLGERSPLPLGELRARFARGAGATGLEEAAHAAGQRLLEAGLADDALRVLHEHGRRPALIEALTQIVAQPSALEPARLEHWLGQLSREETLSQPVLAMAKAARARTAASPGPRWSRVLAPAIAIACTAAAVAGQATGAAPLWTFAALLGAAVVLWIANAAPSSAIALGLVVAWILTGTTAPEQAVAGFASLDWLFVVAVFGLAAAVAQSGLLFRVGLLLVRRLPDGLFSQAGSLLLTGVLLTPLLPTSTGRAAITEPLALAITNALRLRDRSPASAALGLAAWIGAGPLRFLFLNGSSTCLLGWGLLPEASRARFDWITWLIAALPLGALVLIGSMLMLFAVLRPARSTHARRGRLDVQLAVLGPMTARERTMLVVLLVTVCGWVVAPALRLDIGLIAVLGLLAAVATGNFGRQLLQSLDWDHLIFYGVALSVGRLSSSLGLGQMIANALTAQLGLTDLSGVLGVLAIAALGLLVCQALGPDQAVLLLGLAVVPVAAALGMEPWVAIVIILATSGVWLIPSQVPMYLGAYAASEGRLFSPAQSRRAACGYVAVLFIALVLVVPYWTMLGLV